MLSFERILTISEEYFAGDRKHETQNPPKSDADIKWIPYMLDKKEPHDPDYSVFKAFRNNKQTILDIGANYGYSATSIWAAGSECSVLSFEPIVAFSENLRALKTYCPSKFDFEICGVGDKVGELDFIMPVLDGTACSALTTASSKPRVDLMANNLWYHIEHYLPERKARDLKFYRFKSRVYSLDELLNQGTFTVPTTDIVCLKIDTEGFEENVIRGATQTISKHKPLIVAENGDQLGVREALGGLGYLSLHRENETLTERRDRATGPNYFFGHPDQFSDYRNLGLLKYPSK